MVGNRFESDDTFNYVTKFNSSVPRHLVAKDKLVRTASDAVAERSKASTQPWVRIPPASKILSERSRQWCPTLLKSVLSERITQFDSCGAPPFLSPTLLRREGGQVRVAKW